jgi:hypothetical protein
VLELRAGRLLVSRNKLACKSSGLTSFKPLHLEAPLRPPQLRLLFNRSLDAAASFARPCSILNSIAGSRLSHSPGLPRRLRSFSALSIFAMPTLLASRIGSRTLSQRCRLG